MKTAVSIPDALFKRAEAAARRLKLSRSQLYAAAIRDYLELMDAGRITQRLNAVYANVESRLDPVIHEAQIRSLGENRC